MASVFEIDGTGRTGADGDDLGNALIDQTHTKRDDDRRKLGEDQDDGMDEA